MGSTGDRLAHSGILAELSAAARLADLRVALIGGAAVNAFEDPRFTKDVDLTVTAKADAVSRFVSILLEHGFVMVRDEGEGAPSGPDFVQLRRPGTMDVVDIIVAKTEYQDQVIARAVAPAEDSLPVATAEDLIVLKLIANRPVDHTDTYLLGRDNAIDWAYVAHWAAAWGIADRLAALRARLEGRP